MPVNTTAERAGPGAGSLPHPASGAERKESNAKFRSLVLGVGKTKLDEKNVKLERTTQKSNKFCPEINNKLDPETTEALATRLGHLRALRHKPR